jgi:hypothetical protein
MTIGSRSPRWAFVHAAIVLLMAVIIGFTCLGRPLRLVQLLTIGGLSMLAGVAWATAVRRLRQHRSTGG